MKDTMKKKNDVWKISSPMIFLLKNYSSGIKEDIKVPGGNERLPEFDAAQMASHWLTRF